MKQFAQAGLNVLRRLLDSRHIVLIVSTVLLLTCQRYYHLTPWAWLDRVLFFLLAPCVIIMVAWREWPTVYGLRWGDWRRGLLFTLGGVALSTPVLWLVARTPAFRDYYGAGALPWDWLVLDNAIHLLSWEFLFRGFLLFGLARRYGEDAIWLQAVPFAIAHFGKPALETLSTIFGGAAFGYIAYRTDSMLYPFLIHWFIQVFTTVVASGMI